MALKLKMFDTLGMVTLVTPPSMMNPEKISFTLVSVRSEMPQCLLPVPSDPPCKVFIPFSLVSKTSAFVPT